MQVVTFGEKLNTPVVVCLGFFGCMHKGHVALLREAQTIAQSVGAQVALFTFRNNHLKVLGKEVKQLYTFDERVTIYRSLGVDVLLTAQFTEAFKSQSALQFVEKLSNYNVKGIVCGFDYACGSDRKGSEFIQSYFDGIPVKVVDAVCQNGAKISTTYLRGLLGESQIQTANGLLSQPFFFEGEVVRGRGVGKTLNFATANLEVHPDKFLPFGVFCGKTQIDGIIYKCIVNIGAKPTYGIDEVSVESHIIGFDGNLYGARLVISLTNYLREIRKFDSQEQLVQQLKVDKEICLND